MENLAKKFQITNEEAYKLYNDFFKHTAELMKQKEFRNVSILKLGSFWRYKEGVESIIRKQLRRIQKGYEPNQELLETATENLKSFNNGASKDH